MRTNKNGSILLYVLFLSAFLILFFASFQKEIESALLRTVDSHALTKEKSSIEDVLLLAKNHPASTLSVEGNANISLVSLDYDDTAFSGKLGQSETREYWVTHVGSANALGLSVTAPVFYRIAAFQSGSENLASVIASGMIASTGTIALSWSADGHILTLQSLAWYATYSIAQSGATLIPSSSWYHLKRSIGSYESYEGIYQVANFTPKSYPGIPYGSLGMYLSQ